MNFDTNYLRILLCISAREQIINSERIMNPAVKVTCNVVTSLPFIYLFIHTTLAPCASFKEHFHITVKMCVWNIYISCNCVSTTLYMMYHTCKWYTQYNTHYIMCCIHGLLYIVCIMVYLFFEHFCSTIVFLNTFLPFFLYHKQPYMWFTWYNGSLGLIYCPGFILLGDQSIVLLFILTVGKPDIKQIMQKWILQPLV